MRKLIVGLILMLVCSMPSKADAREGWHASFASGSNLHVLPSSVVNNFPNGVKADAHASLLSELDFGYSFENPLSLAFGLELDNIVAVGYKAEVKFSFLEGEHTQPYSYVCAHGGITDVALIAGHAGFGIDSFVQDDFYFFLDTRFGPSWASDDPPEDPVTGNRRMILHLETAISFGVGFMLGDGTKR